jgi:hypothetical protein
MIVSLSKTKVEYMAATHGRKKVVWLHRLCLEIGFEQRAMKINCDSQSEIFLAKKQTHHSKMDHIVVKYHFLRDIVESKKVLLEKVETLENIADYLT